MAFPGRKWGSSRSAEWVSTTLWTSHWTFSALESASWSWSTSAFSTMAIESCEAQGQGSVFAAGLPNPNRSHEVRRDILEDGGLSFRGKVEDLRRGFGL